MLLQFVLLRDAKTVIGIAGGMNAEVIRSVMEVRTPLESLCVEFAIDRITDEEIEALAPFLERIRKKAETGDPTLADAVFEFHHEISVCSGNRLIPLLYYSFKDTAIQLWNRYIVTHNAGQIYQNKLALYEAIKNRDLEKALQYTPGEYPRNSKDYLWP